MTWGHRTLPFPHNLTPGQRRCIEAVRDHGKHTVAAMVLGLAERTFDRHLQRARLRAGVNTTAALVERYEAARRPA